MRDGARHTRLWVVGAITLGAALALFAVNAGKMLVVNDLERSDVILVLAGETEVRPARGVELLDQGYARTVVIDVPAGVNVFGFSEVDLARQYAQKLPEAASVHICPIWGLSTRAEADDAAKCLAGESGKRVLIVTSDFHTRRAVSTFRRAIPGFQFGVAGAYDEAQFGVRWWTHRQWAKTLVDEWLRLIWWTAVDRWR